jgi:hypothetical protein
MADTAAVVPAEAAPASVRRLNVILTDDAYAELESISKETRRSMTEIVRLGLGLIKLAISEQKNKNRLVVTDAALKPVREVVLPL